VPEYIRTLDSTAIHDKQVEKERGDKLDEELRREFRGKKYTKK
jgi:hypothetical protein